MVTKKKQKRKKTKRPGKRRKKGFSKIRFSKILIGFIVLILVVAAAGYFVHNLLQPHYKQEVPVLSKTSPRVRKIPPPHKKKVPTFEIYPKDMPMPKDVSTRDKPSLPPKKISVGPELPRVAIIIDDVGFNKKIAKQFIDLDAGLTLSVLPFSPFGQTIVQYAHNHGTEIMLHLPMEPIEYPKVDPGSGALLTSMSPDQLITQLIIDLDMIPGIFGVNNHMGSKMTAVSEKMNQIFTVFKKRNLFFIDSRTTDKTLAKSSAKLFKVPFEERNIFLDNTLDPESIREEIRRLIRIASQEGTAIGIGHPHQITLDIIDQELPGLWEKVQILPASALVRVIG